MSEFKQQDAGYAKLIDRYSRYIESPVLRLRFLNSALNSTPPKGLLARAPLVGSLPARAMLIVELSKVLPLDSHAPVALRVTSLLYRVRYAVYTLSLILVLSAGASLVYLISKVAGNFAIPTEARGMNPETRTTASDGTSAEAVAAIPAEAGLPLDKVWLAESGDGYEFYSNGARVLTKFEIAGEPREFHRFDLASLVEGRQDFELISKPVGILYHLSESDLLPFADRFNSSLQGRSKSLIEYARERKLYNYLIDRFGRTYRIVRDEFASNHAGNSVWGDARRLYVNLSASFIGVCFEGKSTAGTAIGPDGINEAQIYAARVLTAVLRSKYDIEDANCVTHGLVSINPSNRLMGYHTDWVSGFPFEAIGLGNKNEAEMIAVSELGFSYDQAYIRAAGGRKWAGLQASERRAAATAAQLGAGTADARQARWQVFERAYQTERALEQQ